MPESERPSRAASAPAGSPAMPDRTTLLAFAAFVVLGGGASIAIRFTYGELARRIGQPTASRAVGAANGRNPLPIIVPCHRVIGSNGELTGFRGGIHLKASLLELEQRHGGGPVQGSLF